MKCKSIKVLVLVLLALGAPMTSRADLVTNGGFETGDFTGWTLGGSPDGLVFVCENGKVFGGSVCTTHSGTFAATMGPPSPATLSQNLATTAGQQYSLTFFLRDDNVGQTPNNQFSASWGGMTVFSETNAATSGYTQETFAGLTASSPSTLLQFTFDNLPGGFYLDDVSVNAVPEPNTLALAVTGLLLILSAGKRLQNR